MRDICLDVIDQFEERAKKKNVILQLRSDKQSEEAYGDPKYLRQVVVNLVSNAVAHTKDGTVQIILEKKDTKLQCWVQDNGEGISPEHMPRIFERFYRVDKSRNRQTGGTGLGLSIVKHILERHQSTIELRSEVGKGSVFSFSLPLAASHNEETA